MHTKKEIQALKQKFLDKHTEYNSKTDELKKISDPKNGDIDDELLKAEDGRRELFEELQGALNAYQEACRDNLNEVLDKMTDELHKEMIINSFNERTKNAIDWDQVMDDLNLW